MDGALDDAGDADSSDAHAAGRVVQQNPVYQVFVCVGLIAFGIMHLLIGWISLQIAWGGQGSDQQAVGYRCSAGVGAETRREDRIDGLRGRVVRIGVVAIDRSSHRTHPCDR